MWTGDGQESGLSGRLFRTTRWSVVLEARQGDSPQASKALETLCRTYWYPAYAFVRRRGVMVEEAQDLTQEFFLLMLQRDFLRNVAREKGRFRSFLLVALKNFLASDWTRKHRVKRGGGQTFVSWEELGAEERYGCEPVSDLGPEQLYEQRWALAVMEQALARLQEEFHVQGKSARFEQFKPFLSTESTGEQCADVAKELSMTPGAVSVALHRFRRRYSELLRSVVAHTVATPDEVEDEVQALAQALR